MERGLFPRKNKRRLDRKVIGTRLPESAIKPPTPSRASAMMMVPSSA